MPWLNSSPEFMNTLKELKNDFFRRLSLDEENKKESSHEIFKDEDVSVRMRCLNFMSLYQDCIEQTNDSQFCLPYYKLFLDCKHKVE